MNRIGDNLQHTGSNEEIIKTLSENEVDFILVGGLAVSWYCSSRQADDMDILVNPTKENSIKVKNALAALNINSFSKDAFSKLGVQAPIKRHYYADIITPSSNGPTFEELIIDSVMGNIFHIPIRIPSITNLIKLKQIAIAREKEVLSKHEEDIRLLKNAL